MNNRTPLLLGIMVIVVAVWVADQFKVFSFLENLGKGHQSALAAIDNKIKILSNSIDDGIVAADRLSHLEKLSLPHDPDLARSQYQAWLTALVSKHRLSQSSVDVGMPAAVAINDGGKKHEAYRRYGFTVNASGTLEQVTQFLFDYYHAGHLQKINTMNLNRAGGGRFTITISGEALGLKTCDRKSQLSQVVGNRLAMHSVDDYAGIVRRNIFSREVGATLKLISLSSVTFDKSGVPEAWFKIGANKTTKKLQRGGKLNVSVHEIEVIDIQPRSALVDVDGNMFDLPIGESIFQAMTSPEVAKN